MDRVPCKYHQLGTCQYGNRCMNEHSKKCYFFFVENYCAFGAKCKFDHGSGKSNKKKKGAGSQMIPTALAEEPQPASVQPPHYSAASLSSGRPLPPLSAPTLPAPTGRAPISAPTTSTPIAVTTSSFPPLPKAAAATLPPLSAKAPPTTNLKPEQPSLMHASIDLDHIADDWLGLDELKLTEAAEDMAPLELPSYAQMAQLGLPVNYEEMYTDEEPVYLSDGIALCPYYYTTGTCPYDQCEFVHGQQCAACLCFCITDDTRVQHELECVAGIEESLAQEQRLQQSLDIECGICYERVLDKSKMAERRFGILEGCNHAFCLSCIRNWRHQGATTFNTVRKCPLCQVESHYVIPSSVFVTGGPEKEALIQQYQDSMAQKDCMHFRFGEGTCPFGSSCFYRHRNKDGSAHVPEAPRFRLNASGDVEVVRPTMLSDYLADRL